ncbi:FecR domain-containing protein [Pseudomonas lurida]|uniref:FecR family protein n=1 Tax=Pseudomonas lurida TaxID=244566 RepID=A0ABY9FV82_9PSED|nr:FecR family protein [Pseudomonas lurida]WLH07193.1 FecR family protein [Pseudomonas lurida]
MTPLDDATRAGPDSQVVKQAISWMLRLRNNRANRRLQAQCEDWREAHHDHELAWQRVQALQQELSGQLAAVPGARLTLENSAQGLGRRQALKLLSGVMLVSSAAWISRDLIGWQRWTSDLATATGERRSVQLPDGTRLQLNTDSAVDLDFNPQQRLITLVRGEILVTCGAASAPLLVKTRHGLLEGIDGRFAVRQDSDCTRLSVLSGNVAIHTPHGADGLSLQVHAGENYLVRQTQATLAAPMNMDVGAWADGLIVTRGMRLADFLSEVGRYRHGYLGCSADIADLRLSGVFRLEDTDTLLAILPQTLPVQVRYRTRWWVSLERSA